MDDKGWILLHRELLKKPIWKNSTPEQKSILVTILLMAWHKPNEWEWKSVKFKTQKGEFVSSLEKIALMAGKGISVQNVRASIKRFEKFEFLTNESTKSGRKITIINWDSYQALEKKPTNNPTKGQQRGNKGATTNNECNNVNNVMNDKKTTLAQNLQERFEIFWSSYPKKKSKGDAKKAWKVLNPNQDLLDKIISSINVAKQSQDWTKENGKYIPYPATWIRAEGWENEYTIPQTKYSETTRRNLPVGQEWLDEKLKEMRNENGTGND